jgi:hypothetical protein
MSRAGHAHHDRIERDRLDRLFDRIHRHPERALQGMLSPKPANVLEWDYDQGRRASSRLAGIAAAAPILFGSSALGPMSRRDFFRRTAIAGGAIGAGLYVATPRAHAGFWGFIGAAVIGAAIGWVVNKVMDWGWYKLNESDMRFNASPAPTTNAFHNSFTNPHEVSNNACQFGSRRIAGYDEDFGMDDYTMNFDMNYPELRQIRAEFEARVYISPLIPVSKRVPVEEKHKPVIQQAARQYRLRPGDYDAEYVNVVVDKKKNEHVGVGARVDGQDKYLLL